MKKSYDSLVKENSKLRQLIRILESKTSFPYKRLEGHQKIGAKAKCVCGSKMILDSRFSGGWACLEEVKEYNKLGVHTPLKEGKK